MSKETSNNVLNFLIILFMALVIAYPVSLFIKNRSDLSEAITEEQRNSFISDQEIKLPSQNYMPVEPGAQVGEGYKSVNYTDTGSAIIRVSINNVANLTADQFRQVGSTPYSLLNTVRSNINTPQVLDVVFNDDIINQAFFERETTQVLVNQPEVLVNMIKKQSSEISEFINHPAVQSALSRKEVLNVLAGSKLMGNILESPTGQYFLNNPQEVKNLIAQNEDLKNLSQNENLRFLLLNFEPTKKVASVVFN